MESVNTTIVSDTNVTHYSETLSIQGKKSITIPLGQINITRKVSSVKIILRTCTSELIMDQNKRRLFDCEKNEYTFRTLRSLIRSTQKAKTLLNNIKFEIIVSIKFIFTNIIQNYDSFKIYCNSHCICNFFIFFPGKESYNNSCPFFNDSIRC